MSKITLTAIYKYEENKPTVYLENVPVKDLVHPCFAEYYKVAPVDNILPGSGLTLYYGSNNTSFIHQQRVAAASLGQPIDKADVVVDIGESIWEQLQKENEELKAKGLPEKKEALLGIEDIYKSNILSFARVKSEVRELIWETWRNYVKTPGLHPDGLPDYIGKGNSWDFVSLDPWLLDFLRNEDVLKYQGKDYPNLFKHLSVIIWPSRDKDNVTCYFATLFDENAVKSTETKSYYGKVAAKVSLASPAKSIAEAISHRQAAQDAQDWLKA